MHPHAVPRTEIHVRLHRLLRIHVDVPHEPPWLIGADRQQRKIRFAETRPDRREMRTVAAVAGEKDPPLTDRQHEAAPQRAIAIKGTTCREVLRGRRSDADWALRGRLPP